MLSQFDEVVRSDDPSDAGIVIHRVTTCCSSHEVYSVLWYQGGYQSTAYEWELTATGRNSKAEFKSMNNKEAFKFRKGKANGK